MHCYGLQAKCNSSSGRFVNLEKTSAEVVVRGFVAHLTVQLTYRNDTDQTLEVSYVCPVDAKAAVYSFEAKIEGRTITAYCLEKKKAQEAYVNAVKQGHTAILGTEDALSGDLLHLSLGNLPKGEVAELTLKMVSELAVDTAGAVTFTLPTVFNPRYCPADQPTGPESVPYVSNVAFTNTIDYSLDVRGIVNGSFKIAKITSDSDPINVALEDDGTNATVTQDGGSKRDHDWSFKIFYQTVHKANALQMAGDRSSKGIMKDDVLMLNFFPEIPLQGFSPHNELIFVIDRSGSMGQGNKMQKAKGTLLLFLKSLPPGCRFNIVSFGSHFDTLFKKSSERYTEGTLKKAIKLQQSMNADMGGTEIMGVLRHVYSHDLVPGYARQMIVLTDGEVWNLKQIFELVSRYADETRVFSVGIGDGASTALVQGLANAGRGRYEMVVHDNQLQTKVMGLVASMLQDNVRDLQISCEVIPPQDICLVPKVPPVVFGGQHLILYARLAPKSEVKNVKISGTIADNKISEEIGEQDLKIAHDSNFSFHRLAAKAQLNQWEMEDLENKRDLLIDLSVSSSVVCEATSFVGIDQEQKIIQEEEPCPREQLQCLSLFVGARKCAKPAMTGRLRCGGSNERDGIPHGAAQISLITPGGVNVGNTSNFSNSSTGSSPVGFCSKSAPATIMRKQSRVYKVDDQQQGLLAQVDDQLLNVVSSQRFDGSWSLKECLKFASTAVEKFKELQLKLGLDDACFGTLFTLAFLEHKFGSRKREWQLLQVKGVSFLQAKGITDYQEVIEKCVQILKEA